jgi:hypothetical protein
MDFSYAEQLLAIYIENARRVLVAHFGVDRAERSFFDVVELLREEPKLSSLFLKAVRDSFIKHDPRSLDEGVLPRELVEVATHELRWPEFGEIARERIELKFGGDQRLAASDPAMAVLAAYDPAWEDREFYRKYREQGAA